MKKYQNGYRKMHGYRNYNMLQFLFSKLHSESMVKSDSPKREDSIDEKIISIDYLDSELENSITTDLSYTSNLQITIPSPDTASHFSQFHKKKFKKTPIIKLQNVSNPGYLELTMGPMFSGKTTNLIQSYQRLLSKDISPFVINYSEDTRYSSKNLVSHGKMEIPCVFSKTLGEIWNTSTHPNYINIRIAEVILINEAQFFTDVFDVVLDMVDNDNKRVYLYGLDGDYERHPFVPKTAFFKGGWLDLIPYSDKITKLSAKCKLCSHFAIFSHRLTGETRQIVIGSDNYIPLCRKCYLEMEKH
jgi:thymidine kinase